MATAGLLSIRDNIGLLPQTALAPDGIRVADLVARGRAPHQGFIQQWRETDEDAVHQALEATKLTELSGRLVDELSGGQRQRVWVAMLLAQQTPLLHDLNQAARYADHLIVMRDGEIVTTGTPEDVVSPELIENVFGLQSLVVPDPVTGTPSVIPLRPG